MGRGISVLRPFSLGRLMGAYDQSAFKDNADELAAEVSRLRAKGLAQLGELMRAEIRLSDFGHTYLTQEEIQVKYEQMKKEWEA